MAFDTALNALWLLLGALALVGTLRACYRTAQDRSVGQISLDVIRLALVLAALFPYVSATDDVLRIQTLNDQQHQSHSGKQNQDHNLIRLYETMDTPLVCRIQEITLVLFFVALVVAPATYCHGRKEPTASGRSPPAVSLA